MVKIQLNLTDKADYLVSLYKVTHRLKTKQDAIIKIIEGKK